MLRARREEGCSVIYGLAASFKAEKRKVNVGDAWFRVSPFPLFLRAGVSSLLVSSAFFWSAPLSGNLSFVTFFLFWSYQIWFSLFCFVFCLFWVFFCFFFGRKITFTLAMRWSYEQNFIFWQISPTFRYALILCAEPPFFHFEESLSTDNIRWMLSWALVAIIILCVR